MTRLLSPISFLGGVGPALVPWFNGFVRVIGLASNITCYAATWTCSINALLCEALSYNRKRIHSSEGMKDLVKRTGHNYKSPWFH